MQNLVIVESPTKSRTIASYLGNNYQIEASMGHVRDLPKSEIGVDTEHNFTPKYIIPKDKAKRVNELKKIILEAKKLWLATDPDREGEAIAWHISELLKDKNSKAKSKNIEIRRVVFHEITPEAIKEAFKNPRDLDMRLIDAQQARRVLDRLVGYKLSPVLWKKVKSGLSAGRVQSVALRLIVEREKEVTDFKSEEYWSITAELESKIKNQDLRFKEQVNKFLANLIELNGRKLAIKNKSEAEKHLAVLQKTNYQVLSVLKKEVRRTPPPPFTTSTLQQTASLKLGMSAKKTMSVAQVLYEQGLITYMRTDSVNLSPQSIALTRTFIEQNIGKSYLAASPRVYKTKSKLAQEAHEAIRPTNIRITAEKLKTVSGVTRDHTRLYDLIWKRIVASQMSEATFDATTIDIKAGNYLFRANGSVMKFDGWLKLYEVQNIKDDEGIEKDDEKEKEQILPELNNGENLKLNQLLPEQHFTEPPPRFNEASLIKKLEELGIGRPSTYAPILSTIQERFYVEKIEKKFLPTELGIAVIGFLVKNFADIIDYQFTAEMEDKFDSIAQGMGKWQSVIAEFYKPFEKKVEQTEENADRVKIAPEIVEQKCPLCGKNLQVRFGKFGKFLACSGFPDCKYTQGFEEKLNIKCPDCGGEVVTRRTRKGRTFYGCKNWPSCKFASWTKPKTS